MLQAIEKTPHFPHSPFDATHHNKHNAQLVESIRSYLYPSVFVRDFANWLYSFVNNALQRLVDNILEGNEKYQEFLRAQKRSIPHSIGNHPIIMSNRHDLYQFEKNDEIFEESSKSVDSMRGTRERLQRDRLYVQRLLAEIDNREKRRDMRQKDWASISTRNAPEVRRTFTKQIDGSSHEQQVENIVTFVGQHWELSEERFAHPNVSLHDRIDLFANGKVQSTLNGSIGLSWFPLLSNRSEKTLSIQFNVLRGYYSTTICNDENGQLEVIVTSPPINAPYDTNPIICSYVGNFSAPECIEGNIFANDAIGLQASKEKSAQSVEFKERQELERGKIIGKFRMKKAPQ